jgi:predicted nucleic acid-binding protein
VHVGKHDAALVRGVVSISAAIVVSGGTSACELFARYISEVRKGSDCNPSVATWYDSVDEDRIYLSVLVLGEIRKGIERARSTNPAQARALEKWLSTLSQSYAERILAIDLAVADEWGA